MHYFSCVRNAYIRAQHTKSAQNYKKKMIYAKKMALFLFISKKSSTFAPEFEKNHEFIVRKQYFRHHVPPLGIHAHCHRSFRRFA